MKNLEDLKDLEASIKFMSEKFEKQKSERKTSEN